MKKLLFALAAVAMIFTACNKDKDPKIEDNVIIYDGTTYHMQNVAIYYIWEEVDGELIGESIETDPNGVPMATLDGFHVLSSQLNKTFDLTKFYVQDNPNNVELQFFMSIGDTGIGFRIAQDWYYGFIGETVYESYEPNSGTSMFSNGTLTISDDNDGFVWELDGKLKNGKALQIRLVIPEGWGYSPFVD